MNTRYNLGNTKSRFAITLLKETSRIWGFPSSSREIPLPKTKMAAKIIAHVSCQTSLRVPLSFDKVVITF